MNSSNYGLMGPQEEISGRSILYWIDNEGAHILALKAKRPSITMETLSRLAIWNRGGWRFGNAVADDGMVSKSLVFLEPFGFDISSSHRKGSGKIWDGGQLAVSHDLSLTWGPNHINILLQKLGATSEHLSMICHPKSSMEGIVISGDLHAKRNASTFSMFTLSHVACTLFPNFSVSVDMKIVARICQLARAYALYKNSLFLFLNKMQYLLYVFDSNISFCWQIPFFLGKKMPEFFTFHVFVLIGKFKTMR